jgi:hypothetical protein
MPSRKFPRIELDQMAYDALQIEAVIRKKSTRAIASEAVLRSMSKDTLDFVGYKVEGPQNQNGQSLFTNEDKDITTEGPADHKTIRPEAIDMECRKVGDMEVCEAAPLKKPKLAHNPAALSKIKELWDSGEHNAAEIARQIGYHRKTTYDNIKKMKESGELQESPSEPQIGP